MGGWTKAFKGDGSIECVYDSDGEEDDKYCLKHRGKMSKPESSPPPRSVLQPTPPAPHRAA